MSKIIIPLDPFRAVSEVCIRKRKVDGRKFRVVRVQDDSITGYGGPVFLRYTLGGKKTTGVGKSPVNLSVDFGKFKIAGRISKNCFIHADLERGLAEVFHHHMERRKRLGVFSLDVCGIGFPDSANLPDNSEIVPARFVPFNPSLLGIFGKAVNFISTNASVRFECGEDPKSPIRVHFENLPQLEGVLMPTRVSSWRDYKETDNE